MKIFSPRRGASLLAGLIALALATSTQAQVLDSEQIFVLPVEQSGSDTAGFPITLGIGDIDPAVVTEIGNAPLNDVVIMGLADDGFGLAPTGIGPGSDGLGRIWTLIHTSGSDTQSLALATPVDVPVSGDNPTECYAGPSSVQVLDLNGDAVNDLGFMGSCNSAVGSVYGLQGTGADPFQDPSSLTNLGSQGPNAVFTAPFLITGGQLFLAAQDFNGDGQTDLAFYDYSGTASSDQIHALLNSGALGALPSELSNVDGPVPNPSASQGQLATSGDFNGDGIADIAIAYGFDGNTNLLQVYEGVGDGTFLQEPMAQADFGSELEFLGLASGNFDLNDFSDFALTAIDGGTGDTSIAVVLCAPGSPASCTVSLVDVGDLGTSVASIIVAADFNGDGFDDLANIQTSGSFFAGIDALASVQLRLNDEGSFASAPDQSFALDTTAFTDSFIAQVVADDLDACGGPDLAFTGLALNPQTIGPIGTSSGIAQGADNIQYQAAVAFNPNEEPTANAGTATAVSDGIQIGGNPTCSDPTGDTMEVSWTVVSGTATLSDTTASNPIVTNAGAQAVLQVTCTDPCGLSASDTVTVSSSLTNGFVQGSCGTSLTGAMSGGVNLAWLMIPAAVGGMGWWRRRKS